QTLFPFPAYRTNLSYPVRLSRLTINQLNDFSHSPTASQYFLRIKQRGASRCISSRCFFILPPVNQEADRLTLCELEYPVRMGLQGHVHLVFLTIRVARITHLLCLENFTGHEIAQIL